MQILFVRKDESARYISGMVRTLLYDGTCGLCAKSVQFLLKRERLQQSLQFAPLQGETAAALLREYPQLALLDSVLWVEEQHGVREVKAKSDAALAALGYLGGNWKLLASIARVVPRFMRDAAYDFVARTRYRIFGHDTACLLPTAAQRARFLP